MHASLCMWGTCDFLWGFLVFFFYNNFSELRFVRSLLGIRQGHICQKLAHFLFWLHPQKQQNGCHDNISDDFVFKESRIRSKNSFTYTYNSKCLAARKDGTLFLKTTNDPSNEQQCKYTHLRYT